MFHVERVRFRDRSRSTKVPPKDSDDLIEFGLYPLLHGQFDLRLGLALERLLN